jgi:NTP pyrophosphatase (non-canonical NTP hydrolase)
LADLQEYVRQMKAERGFNTDTLAENFMMLLEECGELAKASRKSTGLKMAHDAAAQDAAAEAADILIILLGICNLMDIDLEAAFRAKEEKNKQRIWK